MASPGDIVDDKYRLLEPVAEGGMATVWVGEHLALETRVAIKLLAFDGDWGGGGRERFLEEARLAASVKHRNVVQTLDFGATDDGVPFIAMELLSGESLADRVHAEAPMHAAEVLELADQLLGALVAVHDTGIVHRDLKPENVLFGRDTDGDFPKLIDFGISKGQRSRRAATRPGMVLGTPEFMSPEQAAAVETIDHRTDLYSLAVILYEMLSGELPYQAEQTSSLLLRIIAGGAPSLRDRGLALPPGLSDVIAKAMSVEPDDRYADATAMRRALAEIRERGGRPEPAPRKPRRVSIPDLDPEPAPDPQRGSWMLAGLAALLLVLIPGVLWLRATSPDEPEAEPTPTAEVSEPPPSSGAPALRNADDHHVYVHLLDFPEDATLTLDDEAFTSAQVDAMRRGDIVEVQVPRRRGRPFNLRIVREGYEDWRMRRWTVRDFEARVVMTPAL